MRTDSPRRAPIVVACLLLVTQSGCGVTLGEPESGSSRASDALESGQLRLDLRTAPSRAAARMEPGRTHVTYQRRDHRPFRVVVALPAGRQLDVKARLVALDSTTAPDPATAPPSTLDVLSQTSSLEEGRDAMLAAARRFGLDRTSIESWYVASRRPRAVAGPSTSASPWLGTRVGYLHLEVQGRYAPPVDDRDPGQTVVHYVLTWDRNPATA